MAIEREGRWKKERQFMPVIVGSEKRRKKKILGRMEQSRREGNADLVRVIREEGARYAEDWLRRLRKRGRVESEAGGRRGYVRM